ncbi:MAG: EAL domain-containing protein [Anaerolineales bacterium]|nr:EAL domain-containing protein [Anaerolineales bacterium]
MIRSPNAERMEHQLGEGPNLLGRHSEIDIHIPDQSASRQHARILVDPSKDEISLTDLESTNGTYLNGTRIQGTHPLKHNDNIRIGRHLITVINQEERHKDNELTSRRKALVTGELMLQSVDNYAVLLHDIGHQLINIPQLDEALERISETVRKMIAAEECKIVLADQIEILKEYGIPEVIFQDVLENNTANIFSLDDIPSKDTKLPGKSIMLVPVEVNEKVEAMIWAWRENHPFGFSKESDLQLVIAVSQQVALSIQRDRFETELLHNAYYDQLTGLCNRTYFSERLGQALAWSKRHEDYMFAVIFMDIDNFQVINDSLGYAAGDEILVKLSMRLLDNLREQDAVSRSDAIARFGGDEFSIFLDDITSERDAFLVADRLKEVLAQPIKIQGQEIYISTSMGITMYTPDYLLPEELLRDAEIAMYRAKEQGKAQIVIYDNVMHNSLVQRLKLETELRRGMNNGEFHLYYQPIISLEDEKVVGLEALLRWHSSSRGYMEPGAFFSALHTSGLIKQLDEWVLNYAARDAVKLIKIFPVDPPFYISVNISANLIQKPDLIEMIDKILKKNRLNTGSLRLEITEKADLGNSQNSQDMFKALQKRGIRLSLDDFGVGYSTLSYLLNFPADALKIDQSFIHALEINPESIKILETLQALASHLDMRLVAEGIETRKQLNQLKNVGCEYGQGFLFSKALPFEEVVEYIRGNLSESGQQAVTG